MTKSSNLPSICHNLENVAASGNLPLLKLIAKSMFLNRD